MIMSKELKNNSSSFIEFSVYSSFFIILLTILGSQIAKIVPDPYMDEVFHVRQAKEYFMGNWKKWDPMITTPPALYVLAVAVLKFWGGGVECGTSNLRTVNLILGGAILLMARLIFNSNGTSNFANERALLIVLLPNLFIFLGLFYTEAGSLFFCLTAQWALQRRKKLMFLGASGLSIMFRQTNLVWVGGFMVGDLICREAESTDLRRVFRTAWKRFKDIGLILIGLVIVFVALVIFNDGSIVLGDKQSHSISLHLAQFFYCISAIFVFCLPVILDSSKRMRIKLRMYWFRFFVFLGLAGVAVWRGTIIHPYLMADNRHWTNFIWRRCLSRSLTLPGAFKFPVRYCLIPVYALEFLLVSLTLDHRGWIWQVGFFGTCALVLIPSPLIEPRYFIVPLTIYLFNCKISSKLVALLQIFWFLVINLFIVGMFLYHPFIWPEQPNVLQRHIW